MLKKFDICFLSILYPEGITTYDKMTRKHRAQNITAIQNNLIESLGRINEKKPWVINTLLVPLFPKGYRLPFVKALPLNGNNGINHTFINLPYFYSTSLFYGAKKHIKDWALTKTNKNLTKILVAYSLTSYTLKAMNYVKTIDPSIRTVIIVPDLPQYTYRETRNPVLSIKNKLGLSKVNRSMNRYTCDVDGYLVFSKYMPEKIPNCKAFMVFEGISSDIFGRIDPKRLFDDSIFEIVYAGGLNKNYGLPLLIDAFQKLEEENIRLLIAGRGDYELEIKKYAESDPRVIFLGEVKRDTLLSLEKGADLLINPRINCGRFTKYSFPSKNMEYLSSGTPTLVYKLDGIPDEYDKYFNYFSNETADAIKASILDIMHNYAESQDKAEKAEKWVLKYKDRLYWGEKILDFFSSL